MAGDQSIPHLHHDSPAHDQFEMDDTSISHTSSIHRLASSNDNETPIPSQKSGVMGVARHTLGLLLLLCVVFLWTTSNFLGSV